MTEGILDCKNVSESEVSADRFTFTVCCNGVIKDMKTFHYREEVFVDNGVKIGGVVCMGDGDGVFA